MRRENKRRKASSGGEPASQSYLNLFTMTARCRKSFCGWRRRRSPREKIWKLIRFLKNDRSNVTGRRIAVSRSPHLSPMIRRRSIIFRVDRDRLGSLLRSPIIHGKIHSMVGTSFRVSPENPRPWRSVRSKLTSCPWAQKARRIRLYANFPTINRKGSAHNGPPKGISVPIREFLDPSFFSSRSTRSISRTMLLELPRRRRRTKNRRDRRGRLSDTLRAWPPATSGYLPSATLSLAVCQWRSRWWIKVARRFRYLGLRDGEEGGRMIRALFLISWDKAAAF